MADLLDDDLLLVQRAGASYKMAGADLKASLGPQPINPGPGDVTSTPNFEGGTGTQGDPYIITPATCPTVGGQVLSSQQLVVVSGRPSDQVIWTDNSVGAGSRFAQPIGVIDGAGQWSGKLIYNDVPDSTVDNTVYTGDLQLGTTYFRWVVTQRVVPPLVEVSAPTISGTENVGQTLTAVQGTANGGTPPITYATRWQRSDTGTGAWSDIAGATGTSYLLVTADGGKYVRAVTKATDSTTPTPQTLDMFSGSSGQIQTSVAPVMGAVTLSDSTAGGNRFTSEVFPVSATLTDDGTPVSTKALKAWVEGALSRRPVSSEITQVAVDTPSVGQTTLTLTDNTDLINFAPGDAVTELGGGDDATGTVGSVNTGANTITLSASSGAWDVGSQVLGPVKVINVTPESDEIAAVAADTPAVGQTTLTLASDKDLVNFAPGDAVYQGGPGGVSTAQIVNDTSPADLAYGNYPLSNMFKLWADQTPQAGRGSLPNLGTGNTWTPATSIPFTTLEIRGNVGGSVPSAATLVINGVRVGDQFINVSGVENVWTTIAGVSSPLTTLHWRYDSANNYVAITGIRIDGAEVLSTEGVVGSVDTTANTIALSSSTGTWSPNTNNFVVGPTKPSQSVRFYCDIDGAGNVSDLQSADPGFTAWTPSGTGPYTGSVTFPATLPSGNPPDTDLPAGTTLTVAVEASNSAGADSAESNTVEPA